MIHYLTKNLVRWMWHQYASHVSSDHTMLVTVIHTIFIQ